MILRLSSAFIVVVFLLLGCADPKMLRHKASDEIQASCKARGCLEPLLIEVIVNGNLRQYKEFNGVPADPELWELLFPTGRHARLTEEFYRYKWSVIQAVLGKHTSPPVFDFSEQEDNPNVEGLPLGQSGSLGLMGPSSMNAYGPGLHMDATGRPFMWQPLWGETGFPDPTLQVKPNAYGPGVGMDQYGRPVRPACAPGWVGPC